MKANPQNATTTEKARRKKGLKGGRSDGLTNQPAGSLIKNRTQYYTINKKYALDLITKCEQLHHCTKTHT